jgi:Type IV pilus assembly protein PilM
MKLSAKIAAIEFDGDEVRLAVVRTSGRLPKVQELHACKAVYAAPEERFDALVAAVQRVVARAKPRPSTFVLCASSQHSVTRVLTVPFRGRRKVAAAVQFELEPYLAFPIEELEVDFTVIREIEGQTEVLAAGMRRTRLEEQVAILEAAGVEAEGIGVDAVGLTALWQGQVRNGTGLTAALHLRNSGSVLVVMYGKSLAYFRHLPVTAGQVYDAPGAAARQVQNSLRAFQTSWQGDDEVGTLTVTGVDLMTDARMLFEEGLSASVTYTDLKKALKGPGLAQANTLAEPVGAGETSDGTLAPEEQPEGTVPEKNNYWTAGIGVALASAGCPYSFDFLKGELAPPVVTQGLIQHVVFSSCMALVVLLSYGGYCFLDYRSNQAELEAIGDEAWELFSDAFPTSLRVKDGPPKNDPGGYQASLFMKEAADDIQSAGPINPALFTQPPLLEILRVLSEKLPDDKAPITNIKLVPATRGGKRLRLRVQGEVKDGAAFAQAVVDLRSSELMHSVQDPRRSTKEGKETFVVDAEI